MRPSGECVSEGVGNTFFAWPAFIVGLPTNYRGKPLELQLNAEKIRWNRVDGVLFRDDAGSASDVDKRAAKVLLRRDILPAEVGCALAHRQIYRMMLRDEISMALVFEDDARLTGSIYRVAIEELLQTPVPRVLALSYGSNSAVTYRKTYTDAGVRGGVLRAIVPPTTTTAYALNIAAARLLLDEERPITHVADWPVRPSTLIQYYFAADAAAVPDPSTSSTIGDRTDTPSERRIARSTERMRRRLLAISHFTWFKHSGYYGSYRAFVQHEFVRMPTFLFAKKRKVPENTEGCQVILESGRILNAVSKLWL